MVTGGFRTRAFMEQVLADGHCDLIGMGRPFCTEPDFPRRLLSGEIQAAPQHEKRLKLGSSKWLSGASPIFFIKLVNVLGGQAWYYLQLFRLADGKPADPGLGMLSAFFGYLWDELSTARRMHRARRHQT